VNKQKSNVFSNKTLNFLDPFYFYFIGPGVENIKNWTKLVESKWTKQNKKTYFPFLHVAMLSNCSCGMQIMCVSPYTAMPIICTMFTLLAALMD